MPTRPTAIAFALFCLGAPALAQTTNTTPPKAESPTRLKIDGGLLGVRNPIPEDEATYISADRLYGNSAEETFLEGNVEVRRNKLKLFSDSINYSPITDRATAKGNLVAVISDGTAILGLGDLGAGLDDAGGGRLVRLHDQHHAGRQFGNSSDPVEHRLG